MGITSGNTSRSVAAVKPVLAVLASLLLLIVVASSVSAAVLITEVLYDPATSESDTEFVELYNTGDTAVDISGWSLNTTTQQALIPQNTIMAPGTYFLISDIDNSGAWPADWPQADFHKEITLPNTNSGVKLIDSNHNIIDVVGWGNPVESLYSGTPHPPVHEGESLSRRQQSSAFIQTGNNSYDFLAALPTPQNSKSGTSEEPTKELTIYASVAGNMPKVDSFSILQDDKPDDGIQISPLPGKLRNLTVNAIVSDADGTDDIQYVRLSGKSQAIDLPPKTNLNSTSSLYEAALPMGFYEAPAIYNLTLVASDSSDLTATKNLSFEYLGIVAFEADTAKISLEGLSGQNADVIGDLDISTPESPTVRNLGNTPLDFRLSASDLNSGSATIPATSLLYSFLDSDFSSSLSGTLSQTPTLKKLNLQPGPQSLRELSLRLIIPAGTMAGSYQGSLYLSGVAS